MEDEERAQQEEYAKQKRNGRNSRERGGGFSQKGVPGRIVPFPTFYCKFVFAHGVVQEKYIIYSVEYRHCIFVFIIFFSKKMDSCLRKSEAPKWRAFTYRLEIID